MHEALSLEEFTEFRALNQTTFSFFSLSRIYQKKSGMPYSGTA